MLCVTCTELETNASSHRWRNFVKPVRSSLGNFEIHSLTECRKDSRSCVVRFSPFYVFRRRQNRNLGFKCASDGRTKFPPGMHAYISCRFSDILDGPQQNGRTLLLVQIFKVRLLAFRRSNKLWWTYFGVFIVAGPRRRLHALIASSGILKFGCCGALKVTWTKPLTSISLWALFCVHSNEIWNKLFENFVESAERINTYQSHKFSPLYSVNAKFLN